MFFTWKNDFSAVSAGRKDPITTRGMLKKNSSRLFSADLGLLWGFVTRALNDLVKHSAPPLLILPGLLSGTN